MITKTKQSQIQQTLTLALQQYKNGNFQEVEDLLTGILKENPSCIEVFKLRAILAHKTNDFDKAILNYKEVIALNPDEVDAYNKLGMLYQQLEKCEEAINNFQKSLTLKLDLDISKRLAYALSKQGRLEEAIDLFNQILEIEPDDLKTRWNRSLTLLKNGNFPEGLPDFEYRKHLPNFQDYYLLDRTLWDGSDLNGKTILFYNGNDGFGDIIQLIRYAPLVAEKGGRVIFACPKPLFRLFSCLSGIELVNLEEKLPNSDVYLSLLSLPYYLGTTLETIPAKIPYINLPKLDQRQDHNFLSLGQNLDSFKIGIVWSSGHRERIGSTTSIYRDCPLSLFISLLSIPEVSLYSLQVGKWASEIDEFKHQDRLYDLTPQIKDFADTATLISQLDLIISVDTAVAHLAGAMGLPVWTLLNFDADCRWLQDRSDTPWYPTMRLFRQQQHGDWESVFAQVIPVLQQHIS